MKTTYRTKMSQCEYLFEIKDVPSLNYSYKLKHEFNKALKWQKLTDHALSKLSTGHYLYFIKTYFKITLYNCTLYLSLGSFNTIIQLVYQLFISLVSMPVSKNYELILLSVY
jgi:hypothetical protein